MTLTAKVAWQAAVKNPELWGAFRDFCAAEAAHSLEAQDEEALNPNATINYSERVLRIVQLTAERRVYSELPERFLQTIHSADE